MNLIFPSMPPVNPATPEEDGMANVTITGEGVELDLGNDQKLLIPGRTILRGSFVIKPGGICDVNHVQLELLAGDVTVAGDAHADEIRVQSNFMQLFPEHGEQPCQDCGIGQATPHSEHVHVLVRIDPEDG